MENLSRHTHRLCEQKVSLNDLIETEAELFDSETKAADSLYQYNIAVSTLNQSVGL